MKNPKRGVFGALEAGRDGARSGKVLLLIYYAHNLPVPIIS